MEAIEEAHILGGTELIQEVAALLLQGAMQRDQLLALLKKQSQLIQDQDHELKKAIERIIFLEAAAAGEESPSSLRLH